MSVFGSPRRSILCNAETLDAGSLRGRPPNLPQALICALLYRLARVVPPLLPISLAVIGFSPMRGSVAERESGCQVISLRHIMSDKRSYVK